jgi:dolichol-phosphate mannosyltransferase
MKIRYTELIGQLLRFGLSGGAGVIAGYATLYVLTEYAGMWYIFSSLIAGVLNGGINFFLEKYWTFKNKNPKTIYKQAGWYALTRITLFAADIGLLYTLVEFAHIYYLVAQIGITIVLSLVSFIVCRHIFSSNKST